MEKRVERCDGCYFWHPVISEEHGACRRHAPVIDESRRGYVSPLGQWPTTLPVEWCGEFKLNGKANAEPADGTVVCTLWYHNGLEGADAETVLLGVYSSPEKRDAARQAYMAAPQSQWPFSREGRYADGEMEVDDPYLIVAREK